MPARSASRRPRRSVDREGLRAACSGRCRCRCGSSGRMVLRNNGGGGSGKYYRGTSEYLPAVDIWAEFGNSLWLVDQDRKLGLRKNVRTSMHFQAIFSTPRKSTGFPRDRPLTFVFSGPEAFSVVLDIST